MKKKCYINLWAGVEKISHLSNRNKTKWSKTNLFAYLCSYKAPKGFTTTGNSYVYKTIWKNGNKEYNEKYIRCYFTIWNLISTIMYKCGPVVLFLKSVYFAISKLILLFSYSFHVLCVILSKVYFYIVRSMFPFLFNWLQSKASVVNQMNHLFFEARGYYFAFFNFLRMVIFTTLFWCWSTLWNSTLKITAFFWHCLTLLISTLNWRSSTL